jgi:hypothetical protein
VSPVKYELAFPLPEDAILYIHCKATRSGNYLHYHAISFDVDPNIFLSTVFSNTPVCVPSVLRTSSLLNIDSQPHTHAGGTVYAVALQNAGHMTIADFRYCRHLTESREMNFFFI